MAGRENAMELKVSFYAILFFYYGKCIKLINDDQHECIISYRFYNVHLFTLQNHVIQDLAKVEFLRVISLLQVDGHVNMQIATTQATIVSFHGILFHKDTTVVLLGKRTCTTRLYNIYRS